MPDVIITANSPGELWGWVRPLVKILKAKKPECRVIIVLVPCAFASGSEWEVARKIPGVDLVVSPGQYLRYMVSGRLPGGQEISPHAVVINMGGDIMHGALLARKLRVPAYSYLWGNRHWDRYFTAYFVSSQQQKEILLGRSIPEEKISIVGNLVSDSVRQAMSEEPPFKFTKNGHLVCLLPGSRPKEVRYIAPFLLRIAEAILEEIPSCSFLLPLSPFVKLESLEESLSSPPAGCDGATGRLVVNGEDLILETRGGAVVHVVQKSQYQAMKLSDLVMTIPGTKCGEAGCLTVPMLVILPLNWPEEIPLLGLPGLLSWIPLAGPILKRLFIRQGIKKFGYVAQPNILAGREIVPEIKGKIEARSVAGEAVRLLKDPGRRAKISEELGSLYGNSHGAAERIAQLLLTTLEGADGKIGTPGARGPGLHALPPLPRGTVQARRDLRPPDGDLRPDEKIEDL